MKILIISGGSIDEMWGRKWVADYEPDDCIAADSDGGGHRHRGAVPGRALAVRRRGRRTRIKKFLKNIMETQRQ